MAKNLFEQFLDFATSKLAGPIAHENIYREESTELSGVAKYLARQELAAKSKEAAAVVPTATGVEKYLARLAAQPTAQDQTTPVSETVQQPLTGVAKYLAGQYKAAIPAAAKPAPAEAPAPAPAPEPKTGVAKYLAGQFKAAVPAAAKPATAAAPEPSSRVAKYLAEQEKASATAEVTAKAKPQPAPAAKTIVEAAKTETKQTHAEEAAKPASSVIHLNDDKRCQARTSKGTQCKHTAHLGHIQRTINKQRYMFSVCNQHHNDAFKPYAALMEKYTTA